jgi:Tol biopolymer transport system component
MSSWSRSARTAALVLALFGLSVCKDDPFAPTDPGLHILSGESTADTISSTLRRPLVVAVVDESGNPAVGRTVRFETVYTPSPFPPHYDEPRVVLRVAGANPVTTTAVTTTDRNGRASVHVSYSYLSGEGKVAITVPEYGYRDTARFEIQPGAFAGVRATPEDTAVYAGQTVPVRAWRVDAIGNPRSESVSLAVASGPATLDVSSGIATTSAIGRVAVVASAADFSDTAWISVVPRAELATQRFQVGNGGPIGIYLVETNGTVLGQLTHGLENDSDIQGWEWSPDGDRLVFAHEQFIYRLTPGEPKVPVFRTDGGLLSTARLSRDGAWIYYTEQRSAEPHRGNLRVRIDGTDRQPLGHPSSFGLDRYPAPSHDGRFLAYATDRSPCGQDVCIQILDLATNQDRVYGTRGYFVRGRLAAWSPVEDLIAYANESRIAVIRSDGTGERILASDIHAVTWMDWSPDGRWLVVAGYGPVLLIDVHTGMRLPIAQLYDYGPSAWRP